MGPLPRDRALELFKVGSRTENLRALELLCSSEHGVYKIRIPECQAVCYCCCCGNNTVASEEPKQESG